MRDLLWRLFVVLLEGVAAAGAASLFLQGAALFWVRQLLVRVAAEALLGGTLVLFRVRQEVRGQLLDLAVSKMLRLLWAERGRVVFVHSCLIY